MFILLVAYHPFDPNGDATDDEMWSAIVNAQVCNTRVTLT